jgi:hypothetical protein
MMLGQSLRVAKVAGEGHAISGLTLALAPDLSKDRGAP